MSYKTFPSNSRHILQSFNIFRKFRFPWSQANEKLNLHIFHRGLIDKIFTSASFSFKKILYICNFAHFEQGTDIKRVALNKCILMTNNS